MSFQAMAWAANQTTKNSIQKLVLMMLANYADENHSCYPSYQHLANICVCTKKTIVRACQQLEEAELIETEKRFDDKGKQTSNRFIIRGVKNDPVGGTKTTPNTIRSILKDNINKRGDKNNTPYSIEFLEWWDAYPTNSGSKKEAFKSWLKVTDLFIDKKELLSRTRMFQENQKGKDRKYIPHATTFLNQNRWETVKEFKKQQATKNQLAG